jgi:hypothetical protein
MFHTWELSSNGASTRFTEPGPAKLAPEPAHACEPPCVARARQIEPDGGLAPGPEQDARQHVLREHRKRVAGGLGRQADARDRPEQLIGTLFHRFFFFFFFFFFLAIFFFFFFSATEFYEFFSPKMTGGAKDDAPKSQDKGTAS